MQTQNHDQIKIIGAGFGRTGTQSLQYALNILGYKCYHMDSIFENPKDRPKWLKLAEQQDGDRDWDIIFKPNNYDATVDFPSSVFYKDQMSYYPNAKVILTIRESDDIWYKSIMNTNMAVRKIRRESYYYRFKSLIYGNEQEKLCCEIMGKRLFNGDSEMKNSENAKKIYRDWIEDVKKTVPKEKLLILDLKENKGSWESLCNFLNVDIPKDENNQIIKFPHVNSTKQRAKQIQRLKRNATIFNFVVFSAIVAVGYGAYCCIDSKSTANAYDHDKSSKS